MKLSSERRSSSLNNIREDGKMTDLSGSGTGSSSSGSSGSSGIGLRDVKMSEIQSKGSVVLSDDTAHVIRGKAPVTKVDPIQDKKLSRIECWLLLTAGTIGGLVCSLVISYSIIELTNRIESIGNFTDLARPVDGLSDNVYHLYTELRQFDHIYQDMDKIKPWLFVVNDTIDLISEAITSGGNIERDIRISLGQITPIWSQVSNNLLLLEFQMRNINSRLQHDWKSEFRPWLQQLNKTMMSIQLTMKDSSRVSREISKEYSKLNPLGSVDNIGVNTIGVDNIGVDNVGVDNIDIETIDVDNVGVDNVDEGVDNVVDNVGEGVDNVGEGVDNVGEGVDNSVINNGATNADIGGEGAGTGTGTATATAGTGSSSVSW